MKTQLDSLNEQLILIAKAKIGIRRKIVYLERYIKTLKNNTNGDIQQSKG